MTLDVAKYFENLVKKEAKISHMNLSVKAGKTSKMKSSVKDAIITDNGETYLQDANYVLFFTKQEGWDSSSKKKLFELVNRALGNAANNSNESDYKVLKTKAVAEADDAGQEATEPEEQVKAEEPAVEEGNVETTLFLKVTLK